MCPTTRTSTLVTSPSPTKARPGEEGRVGSSLLDKDWGARVPDYISKCCLSALVFTMGLMMKGDWLVFLAFWSRSGEGEVEEEQEQEGDIVPWLRQRFDGYLGVLVRTRPFNMILILKFTFQIPSVLVGYIFYFGIGGYLHVSYNYIIEPENKATKKILKNCTVFPFR